MRATLTTHHIIFDLIIFFEKYKIKHYLFVVYLTKISDTLITYPWPIT
jgi:hypothetical protein